ncbi:hypothetical protein M8312_05955 [Sphingomonas sp. KRR8]|uniref:hypothetical protein n=1 Tax=Sphingomonas sp. KRR8 TaxID=2942996 RepID=UPI00202031CC|nr:hypothetical protein [Sphingomonas sp. KRR8]URD62047.1 hypothetical protein M8312_05955 [Sphingomonas sp. KRR8]
MARLTRTKALIVITVILAGALVFNWQSLLFASAVATSDQRPTLLREAEWGQSATAKAFKQRFHAGSSEASLLAWLQAETFKTNRQAHEATLKVGGAPCAEDVTVTWAADRGIINKADAFVTEAGCL